MTLLILSYSGSYPGWWRLRWAGVIGKTLDQSHCWGTSDQPLTDNYGYHKVGRNLWGYGWFFRIGFSLWNYGVGPSRRLTLEANIYTQDTSLTCFLHQPPNRDNTLSSQHLYSPIRLKQSPHTNNKYQPHISIWLSKDGHHVQHLSRMPPPAASSSS